MRPDMLEQPPALQNERLGPRYRLSRRVALSQGVRQETREEGRGEERRGEERRQERREEKRREEKRREEKRREEKRREEKRREEC